VAGFDITEEPKKERRSVLEGKAGVARNRERVPRGAGPSIHGSKSRLGSGKREDQFISRKSWNTSGEEKRGMDLPLPIRKERNGDTCGESFFLNPKELSLYPKGYVVPLK